MCSSECSLILVKRLYDALGLQVHSKKRPDNRQAASLFSLSLAVDPELVRSACYRTGSGSDRVLYSTGKSNPSCAQISLGTKLNVRTAPGSVTAPPGFSSILLLV